MSGCRELLTCLCTASSAASVSQDPRRKVLSLHRATHIGPALGIILSAQRSLLPCAPHLAQLCCGLWGFIRGMNKNISTRIWVRELPSLCFYITPVYSSTLMLISTTVT